MFPIENSKDPVYGLIQSLQFAPNRRLAIIAMMAYFTESYAHATASMN